jgi:hypothetical protein
MNRRPFDSATMTPPILSRTPGPLTTRREFLAASAWLMSPLALAANPQKFQVLLRSPW